MTETTARTAATHAEPPVWRRLALSPTSWGIVLLVCATVVTLAVADLGIVQFILMLVGGWCLGVAFVNHTYRMPRNGLILHLGGAIVAAAVVVVATETGGDLSPGMPEPLVAVLVVLRMAAIPATGWMWLGLIGRVTDAMTRRERRRAPVRVAPGWERDDSGDGSFVSFRAVPLRMRGVVLAIAGIVVVVAGAGVALMIAFDDVVMHLGARLVIVIMGLALGLPAYVVLMAALRRRTEECRVAFGDDEVRIDVGASSHVIPFARLDHLRWRTKTDYARIEARGCEVDLSLFAGLAKAPAGATAELPELPRRVFRRLELSGLSLESSRRGEVMTFRRTG